MSETQLLTLDIVYDDQLAVEDVRALCALTAETRFFSEEEVLIVEELAWAAITGGEESGYHFLLARPEADTPVSAAGFACFGPVPCTKGSWDLYWIVVDQAMQGRGLGRRILRECERRMLAMGVRKVFVETSSREQYAPTRSFYESCGYRLESRMMDYYDRGEDCLVYTRSLD
ncbi:GNAT family N-acetyltransferase [Pseudodesulfovibrio sp. F-1]|uniref:GNAT family N-acetyltransferase n=1 Tax=Pseudodesulfovibrio alkaliphilus TaxID=2661613 RepID=A0A7K1KK70_9BACT|nr:GNAT family N-acetyltransferase [Pseudodesulfovibrio alkaliphilus]MUM76459.1 GNAT family N-acetyltransferase [Pseudodesulfovibrio alkaliphilus]